MAVPFNISLGQIAHYATLPGAADALTLVPLAAAGLQAAATIRDHDTLAAVLAANTEHGMGRINITSGITITVSDAADTKEIDFPDQVWVAPTGAAVGAVLVVYTPDTGTSTDSQRIPLTYQDFPVTLTGVNVVYRTSTAVFTGS